MARRTMKYIKTRFDKYGKDNCKRAYKLNREDGEGANTIGHMLGFTTNQVDAMIFAWEDFMDTITEIEIECETEIENHLYITGETE